MELIRDITWKEVFNNWATRENSNPTWIECATVTCGWPNWQTWREYTAKLMKAKSRSWQLFKFTRPEVEIPQIIIGPFPGWQKKVTNKNHTTFAQLFDIPNQYNELSQHNGILQIQKGLPFNTELIGLLYNDDIILIDGHHRIAAIMLSLKQKKEIDYSKVSITIALAKLKENKFSLIKMMLNKGTTNPNRD